MTGLIALAVTLLVATAAGVALRRRSGRFRSVQATPLPVAVHEQAATGKDVLTAADLGAGLGERATLVQFSTAFCAPCRPTRQILAGVAGMVDGVRHVEVDATTRLDLVRRLRIASTPTILVLGPDGVIGKRASGLPRKADVIAALGQVIGPENAGKETFAESGSDSRSESE
jgi:thiol-disulfide isomerase/thioredoxin